ncbi:DUF397 domain-containing protein [Amycolatopsis nigrescens]|uniref:DUF397 domain-containing protein n=1 Tax=Amycolatopsis nigrescens TaxID=381445 RepID=UPI000A0363A2|nr:DUF397 domain-containing protein [Amycolatopsis nigrescens]
MTDSRDSTIWRKSSYSPNGNQDCVEVGFQAPEVLVRDTKDRSGGTLSFGAAEWRAFLAGYRSQAH